MLTALGGVDVNVDVPFGENGLINDLLMPNGAAACRFSGHSGLQFGQACRTARYDRKYQSKRRINGDRR